MGSTYVGSMSKPKATVKGRDTLSSTFTIDLTAVELYILPKLVTYAANNCDAIDKLPPEEQYELLASILKRAREEIKKLKEK